jgi:hypothetical protein
MKTEAEESAFRGGLAAIIALGNREPSKGVHELQLILKMSLVHNCRQMIHVSDTFVE